MHERAAADPQNDGSWNSISIRGRRSALPLTVHPVSRRLQDALKGYGPVGPSILEVRATPGGKSKSWNQSSGLGTPSRVSRDKEILMAAYELA